MLFVPFHDCQLLGCRTVALVMLEHTALYACPDPTTLTSHLQKFSKEMAPYLLLSFISSEFSRSTTTQLFQKSRPKSASLLLLCSWSNRSRIIDAGVQDSWSA